MDRNLGATGTVATGAVYYPIEVGNIYTYGFYYQWGRKDPFRYTHPEYGGEPATILAGSVATSIQNPDRFMTSNSDCSSSPNNHLWGVTGAKSPYDPCPVGWRVPKHGTWNGLSFAAAQARYPWTRLRRFNNGYWWHGSSSSSYRAGYMRSTSNDVWYHDTASNIGSWDAERGYGFAVRCVQE